MRLLLSATLLALVLSGPVAVQAAGDSDKMSEDMERAQRRAEQLWREGQEKILEGVETIIKAFPRYEAPEITEDGDVIIRRKPDPEDAPTDQPPARGEADAESEPKAI